MTMAEISALPGMATRQARTDLTMQAMPPILLVVLATATILPIGALLVRAFLGKDGGFVGLENFLRYGAEPGLVIAAWNSVSLSTISTVIAMALAFPFAYTLVRTSIPGRGIFRLIALLPLLAPSLLPAFGFVYLFGNQGWLKGWLLGESLYGPVGIILASVFYVFPHAVLILSAGLSAGDQRHYEAARALRAGPWRRFVTVTLPSCRYAAISAASIAFILAFTDFGIPSVVGGSTNVLATDIYKLVIGRFDFEMGAVVGVLLLLPAVVAYGIDWLARQSQRSMITGKSVPIRAERLPLRDAILFAFATLVAIAILGVIGMAIFGSLVKFWPYNLSLGLQNYERLFTDDDEFRALENSLVLAFGTAMAGTGLVALSGWMIARKLGHGLVRNGLHGVAMMPVAVPGLVLGLGYVFFFNYPGNPLHALQGSLALIILCTVAHFYTVPHLMVVNELMRLDREIDLAAQALRIGPAGTARRIHGPVLLPTLIDVAVYFFVNAMTTVSALIFLFTAQTRPASIAVINLVEGSRIGQASAFAVVIMILSMLAAAIQLTARHLVIRAQGWRRQVK
jgi:iron(III) transport system permease protein